MKTILLSISIVLILFSGVFAQDQTVRGHWKDTNHDGVKDTYVQPYHRSTPNSNPYDNYSTKGNTNPYTGEKGSVNPDRSSNPLFK